MKPMRQLAFAWLLVVATPGALPAQTPGCVGDCDADGVVRIDELIRLVSAVQGLPCVIPPHCPPPDPCLGLDADADGLLSINEMTLAINRLVEAVGNGLTGCPAHPVPTPTADELLAVLMESRAAWNRIGAVRYRMLERISCYCLFDHPHLVAIEVLDNQIVSIRDVWTGAAVTAPPPNAYRTVDGVFSLIEEAIDSGAERVSVKYDMYVGAPIETYIDYDTAVVDEEMGFRLSDMTIWTE